MNTRGRVDQQGRRSRLARVAALAAALACAPGPAWVPGPGQAGEGRSAWAVAGRQAQMERRRAVQWRRGRRPW